MSLWKEGAKREEGMPREPTRAGAALSLALSHACPISLAPFFPVGANGSGKSNFFHGECGGGERGAGVCVPLPSPPPRHRFSFFDCLAQICLLLRPHPRPRTPLRDPKHRHLFADRSFALIGPGPRVGGTVSGCGGTKEACTHPYLNVAPLLLSPLSSHPVRPGGRFHHPARGGPPAPAARAFGVTACERIESCSAVSLFQKSTLFSSIHPHSLSLSAHRRAPATPSRPPTWRSSSTTRTAVFPSTGRRCACAGRSG